MIWTLYPAADFYKNMPQWEKLNAENLGSAVLSSEFMQWLLRYFGSGNEILAICTDQDSPVAMAIVCKVCPFVWQTFQPSQAPLGAWVARPSLPLDWLLKKLIETLPGMPLLLAITQQDPELIPRPQPTKNILTLDYHETARITVKGSFDDYWRKRGKNLRHNLNRQRNTLSTKGVSMRCETVTAASSAKSVVSEYGQLESTGWKNAIGTAVHSNNQQGKFYGDMLEDLLSKGLGRCYRYYYDNKIVAIDLCMQHYETLTILKTSYDESIQGSSPALHLLKAAMAEIFHDGGIKRVEFYGKLMDWHTKWTDEIRMLYHVNYYRWPSIKWLRSRLQSG